MVYSLNASCQAKSFWNFIICFSLSVHTIQIVMGNKEFGSQQRKVEEHLSSGSSFYPSLSRDGNLVSWGSHWVEGTLLRFSIPEFSNSDP